MCTCTIIYCRFYNFFYFILDFKNFFLIFIYFGLLRTCTVHVDTCRYQPYWNRIFINLLHLHLHFCFNLMLYTVNVFMHVHVVQYNINSCWRVATMNITLLSNFVKVWIQLQYTPIHECVFVRKPFKWLIDTKVKATTSTRSRASGRLIGCTSAHWSSTRWSVSSFQRRTKK